MQLRTEIEIDAPALRVWTTLTELGRYPEWNPFLSSLEGELAVGSRLRVTMSSPDGAERTLECEVTQVDPERELRWRGRLWFKGVFDQEHFCLLQPLGEARTRFVQGQNVEGFLVRHLGPRLTELTRGMIGMNQALKKRCEAS